MTSPETDGNQSPQIDAQKERVGQTLFQVRFGLGPHTVRFSYWHETIVQDLNIFFQPSNATQRNIFFCEDALGSQTYENTLKAAYKHYGKYSTAYEFARLYRLRDGFPPSATVEASYNSQLRSLHPLASDGSEFLHKVFGVIDEIVDKNGILIDVETEKRKDPKEREQMERILMQGQSPRPKSVEEFRQHAIGLWNMKRVRDRKITDDLVELYKKAIGRNEATKVYVSLGQNHSGVNDLLAAKLYKKPSFEPSVTLGEFQPPRREIFPHAISLLDLGKPISSEQWQALYEEAMMPPR